MKDKEHFRHIFDRQLGLLFRQILRRSWRKPGRFFWLLRLTVAQMRAAAKRRRWRGRGISVPPILIASITPRCNLDCHGCYSRALDREEEEEMGRGRWLEIFREAAHLGVSIVMLAGGEPLLRPDFLEIPARLPKVLFLVFTNGMLLGEACIDAFRRERNLIPVLSMEGFATETDCRRGPGVFARGNEVCRQLKKHGLFFGLSVTLTRENYDTATGEDFIGAAIASGCGLLFLVEFTPVAPGTEILVLTPAQREELPSRIASLSERLHMPIVAFPGDEEPYGGCLAAGRGFVHVSASGRIEPCPFAPFSDAGLVRGTLLQALQSPLLRAVRENHGQLSETNGGCALWNRRDWIESLSRQA